MAECDTCANLVYDEEYEEYVCDVNMDEDDLARFLSDKRNIVHIIITVMSTVWFKNRCSVLLEIKPILAL